MSLTTPIPRDLDTAFPGENWFFYWKTSASLWKTKLSEFPGTRIIIPINWSFHSETGDQFDFGELRPESDLKKLVEIAKEARKEVVFFLPVTPAPYLANGGLPHLLARTPMINRDLMSYGIIDSEENLIKLSSFFDPRVFEAFNRFVKKLGTYFAEHKISSDLWGIRSGYLNNGHFYSFLEDYSKIFEQSYGRFLTGKKSPDEVISPIEDKQFKFEFLKTVQELYVTNARECIGINFEGVLDVTFIGASTDKFLKRMYGTISVADYTAEIFESLAKDLIPSSVLINQKYRNTVLGRELNDLIANSYLPSRLASSSFEQDDLAIFEPLTFFKVYQKVDGVSSLFQSWDSLKLMPYLKEKYGWSYKVISNDTLNLHENKGTYSEQISLFHGHDIDRTIFSQLLKIFMNGGRVVLNRSGLSDEYSRKLEVFFLENSLPVEKVNLYTNIQNIQLGDGRIVIFDGEALIENSREHLLDFWHKIIDTFSIINVELKNADGIDYYWRTRPSTNNELKFEEVRRLSLYNPTSYRKKLKLNLTKNFVIYKVVDEINVNVQTFPNEVDIELLPEGSVILDFGVFS